MSTYGQLKQQIAELEKRAAVARTEEAAKAIEAIKQQIAEYGLTAADLGLQITRRAGARTTKGRKIVLAPKYRDAKTGKSWNGHGKRPGWIVTAQDKGKLDELLIAKASPQAKASVKVVAKKAQKKAAPTAKPATRTPKKPTAKKAAASVKKPQTGATPSAPETK